MVSVLWWRPSHMEGQLMTPMFWVVNWKTDFKKLQTLELCGGGITDVGVKNIKDLTSLTSLNLSQNSRITDNALHHLSGKACQLDFVQYRFEGSSCRLHTYLLIVHNSLKTICEAPTCILSWFSHHPHFKHNPCLSRSVVILQPIDILQGLYNLKLLCGVGSVGMVGLVSLNVANSKVTNAGLQHLRPLTNLTSLALQACKVTLPAVERLRASGLPNLTIIRLH